MQESKQRDWCSRSPRKMTASRGLNIRDFYRWDTRRIQSLQAWWAAWDAEKDRRTVWCFFFLIRRCGEIQYFFIFSSHEFTFFFLSEVVRFLIWNAVVGRDQASITDELRWGVWVVTGRKKRASCAMLVFKFHSILPVIVHNWNFILCEGHGGLQDAV